MSKNISFICTWFCLLQAYTNYVSQFYQREVWGSYSSVDEDSSIVGHNALSIGE